MSAPDAAATTTSDTGEHRAAESQAPVAPAFAFAITADVKASADEWTPPPAPGVAEPASKRMRRLEAEAALLGEQQHMEIVVQMNTGKALVLKVLASARAEDLACIVSDIVWWAPEMQRIVSPLGTLLPLGSALKPPAEMALRRAERGKTALERAAGVLAIAAAKETAALREAAMAKEAALVRSGRKAARKPGQPTAADEVQPVRPNWTPNIYSTDVLPVVAGRPVYRVRHATYRDAMRLSRWVRSVDPEDGAADVSVSVQPRLTLHPTLLVTNLDASVTLCRLPVGEVSDAAPVPCKLRHEEATNEITLTPAVPLAPFSVYRLYVNGAAFKAHLPAEEGVSRSGAGGRGGGGGAAWEGKEGKECSADEGKEGKDDDRSVRSGGSRSLNRSRGGTLSSGFPGRGDDLAPPPRALSRASSRSTLVGGAGGAGGALLAASSSRAGRSAGDAGSGPASPRSPSRDGGLASPRSPSREGAAPSGAGFGTSGAGGTGLRTTSRGRSRDSARKGVRSASRSGTAGAAAATAGAGAGRPGTSDALASALAAALQGMKTPAQIAAEKEAANRARIAELPAAVAAPARRRAAANIWAAAGKPKGNPVPPAAAVAAAAARRSGRSGSAGGTARSSRPGTAGGAGASTSRTRVPSAGASARSAAAGAGVGAATAASSRSAAPLRLESERSGSASSTGRPRLLSGGTATDGPASVHSGGDDKDNKETSLTEFAPVRPLKRYARPFGSRAIPESTRLQRLGRGEADGAHVALTSIFFTFRTGPAPARLYVAPRIDVLRPRPPPLPGSQPLLTQGPPASNGTNGTPGKAGGGSGSSPSSSRPPSARSAGGGSGSARTASAGRSRSSRSPAGTPAGQGPTSASSLFGSTVGVSSSAGTSNGSGARGYVAATGKAGAVASAAAPPIDDDEADPDDVVDLVPVTAEYLQAQRERAAAAAAARGRGVGAGVAGAATGVAGSGRGRSSSPASGPSAAAAGFAGGSSSGSGSGGGKSSSRPGTPGRVCGAPSSSGGAPADAASSSTFSNAGVGTGAGAGAVTADGTVAVAYSDAAHVAAAEAVAKALASFAAEAPTKFAVYLPQGIAGTLHDMLSSLWDRLKPEIEAQTAALRRRLQVAADSAAAPVAAEEDAATAAAAEDEVADLDSEDYPELKRLREAAKRRKRNRRRRGLDLDAASKAVDPGAAGSVGHADSTLDADAEAAGGIAGAAAATGSGAAGGGVAGAGGASVRSSSSSATAASTQQNGPAAGQALAHAQGQGQTGPPPDTGAAADVPPHVEAAVAAVQAAAAAAQAEAAERAAAIAAGFGLARFAESSGAEPVFAAAGGDGDTRSVTVGAAARDGDARSGDVAASAASSVAPSSAFGVDSIGSGTLPYSSYSVAAESAAALRPAADSLATATEGDLRALSEFGSSAVSGSDGGNTGGGIDPTGRSGAGKPSGSRFDRYADAAASASGSDGRSVASGDTDAAPWHDGDSLDASPARAVPSSGGPGAGAGAGAGAGIGIALRAGAARAGVGAPSGHQAQAPVQARASGGAAVGVTVPPFHIPALSPGVGSGIGADLGATGGLGLGSIAAVDDMVAEGQISKHHAAGSGQQQQRHVPSGGTALLAGAAQAVAEAARGASVSVGGGDDSLMGGGSIYGSVVGGVNLPDGELTAAGAELVAAVHASLMPFYTVPHHRPRPRPGDVLLLMQLAHRRRIVTTPIVPHAPHEADPGRGLWLAFNGCHMRMSVIKPPAPPPPGTLLATRGLGGTGRSSGSPSPRRRKAEAAARAAAALPPTPSFILYQQPGAQNGSAGTPGGAAGVARKPLFLRADSFSVAAKAIDSAPTAPLPSDFVVGQAEDDDGDDARRRAGKSTSPARGRLRAVASVARLSVGLNRSPSATGSALSRSPSRRTFELGSPTGAGGGSGAGLLGGIRGSPTSGKAGESDSSDEDREPIDVTVALGAVALWEAGDTAMVADGDVVTVSVAIPYHLVKPTLQPRHLAPLPPSREELLRRRRLEQAMAAAAKSGWGSGRPESRSGGAPPGSASGSGRPTTPGGSGSGGGGSVQMGSGSAQTAAVPGRNAAPPASFWG